jgi:DNA-binding CsgD family transcriptional regulator
LQNHRGQVRLSVRQVQVLRLLCTEPGLGYKEIAGKLRISSNTVAAHICDMQQALGLHSRNVLVMWGWQHPEAFQGEWVDPKMHKPGCRCEGPLCKVLPMPAGEEAA